MENRMVTVYWHVTGEERGRMILGQDGEKW